MSGCAHTNPNDACASCWREKWNATLDREARWIEKLAEAESQRDRLLEENEQKRVALLLDAAAFARLRARWPHIEFPVRRPGRVADPGPPACLRCMIENEIEGPKP